MAKTVRVHLSLSGERPQTGDPKNSGACTWGPGIVVSSGGVPGRFSTTVTTGALLELTAANQASANDVSIVFGRSTSAQDGAWLGYIHNTTQASRHIGIGHLGQQATLAITNTGSVGIGTTSPSEKLHVVGNLRVQGSTDCTLGNGSGGTNCSSDIRLKTNVQEIENPLEKILSLRGVEFDWNEKSQSPGQHSIGVIAQDVEKQFPTAVIEDSSTGYKKVDYAVLVAPIIQAFKDLNKRIMELFTLSESHSREIASIKAQADVDGKSKDQKIQKLENENDALKKRLDNQQKELEAIKRKLGL